MQCFKIIRKVKFSTEIIKSARESKLYIEEDCDLDKAVEKLTNWCQEMKDRATTEKRVRCDKPKFEMSDEIRNLRTLICLLPRGSTDWKKVRNRLVDAIRKAKRFAIRSKVEKGKSIWSILNGKSSNQKIELENSEGTKIEDEEEIANMFAQHFEVKVNSLKRTPEPENVIEVMKSHYKNCSEWNIGRLSEHEVAKLIDNLPSKTSSGFDGISYRLIKQLKFEVLQPLTVIINKSVNSGIFPLQWKNAKVCPVYKKKGPKNKVDSYRPVSLTSSLGKMLERAVRYQVQKHIQSKNLLPENLHGFRKGFSTATAITEVLDAINKAKEAGQKVMVVGLDASAAFDLLPRPLLIQNLKTIGAGDQTLNWFKSYLNNRSSQVMVSGRSSKEWETDTGIIQGAPLSPDGYNIRSISQPLWLQEVAKDVPIVLYADDNMAVVAAKTIQECQEKAQLVANRLVQWFDKVVLCLNTKKSELMGIACEPEPLKIGDELVMPS